MKDARIGLIGAGRIGKVHAEDIDTPITTLPFANGTIDNCREAAYGYDQRVEVKE